jgi:hypothetical protein
MRLARALAFILVLTPAVGRADAPIGQIDQQPDSPSSALTLAITGTVLPLGAGAGLAGAGNGWGLVLAGTGLALGPSLGHLYAGEVGRAVGMTALRAGLLTGAFYLFLGGVLGDTGHPGELFAGTAVLLAATAGLALYDIIDAPRAAERSNRRSGLQLLGVAPVVARDAAGGTMGGLAVAARF